MPGVYAFFAAVFMHLAHIFARMPSGIRAHWRLGYVLFVLVRL